MSRQVDERVVSMKFDNARFEQNVQASMSTLDKLKQKLNLTGAAKGFDNVNKAAKNVNMSGLGSSIEAVSSKFSALEVMGVTTLANLTNSAVNAGKRMISALTIEPVTTGFNEYELKMDSVKTIMASTGEKVETVNKYLEELNEYSDQTIYSFADMTQNIGKFTNAGVKLEDAVYAIKGISNEAAVSGANANEASRAMYNFAQALSSGYVKLIDWKSIENANMATVEFKQQLIDSAVAAGTLTKAADGMYTTLKGNTMSATKDFNDTLQDQWMTSEVLIDTLKRYADENTDIGKKAKAAAQDVTKLSQVFDILKETAQSGWAKTWEIIFGDIEKAKALFTPLTNFLSGIIDKMSDWRNELLEGALGKNFKFLLNGINGMLNPVKEVVDNLKDYSKVVDEIIAGKWGNAPTRWQDLAAAGYDWAHAQNLVNERLGCSVRHATNYTEAQKGQTQATTKATQATADQIKELLKLSDAELLAKGYTKEQIKALRDLEKMAKRLGLSIDEFLEKIDEIDGRWILLNAFKNIGKGIVAVFKAMKDAWVEIFPPVTSEHLFNIILGFHDLSRWIKVSDDTADKMKRTFKGVFAIINIITTILGGGLKIAFKILTAILGHFNMNIWDLTAIIGDALVKFQDWLLSMLDFSGIVEVVVPWIIKGAKAIGNWFKSLKDTEEFKKFVKLLQNGLKPITDWINKLKDSENIGRDIILGLLNGLRSGIKIVGDFMWKLGTTMLSKIEEVLDIHSPSREFMEVGKDIILGLWNGLKKGAKLVWDIIKLIGTKCLEFIRNIDIGSIIAAAISIGTIIVVGKLAKAIEALASPLEGLGDMFEGIGARFKAKAWELRAKALLNLAIAIAVLAGSLWLVSQIPHESLWESFAAIGALAGVMVLLAVVAKLMSDPKSNFSKQAISILALSASMVLLAIALQKVAAIDAEGTKHALKTLGIVVLGMAALMTIYGLFVKGKAGANMDKAGAMFIKMALTMLLMEIVIRRLATLDEATVTNGLKVMGLISGIFAVMIAVSYLAGQYSSKAGTMLIKMSVAMLLMGVVIKRLAELDDATVKQGLKVVGFISLLFAAIIAVSALAGKNSGKAGTLLLTMSVALLIMVTVIKQIAELDDKIVDRGLKVIRRIGLLFVAIIAVSLLAGDNAAKAGVMLLLMSVSLAILVGVISLLSKLNPDSLDTALLAVSVLMVLFGGLIIATHFAKDCKGTLTVMVVAISILIAAVIGLSFIDPSKLTAPVIALSVLMLMFGTMVALASKCQSAMGPLIVMTVAVGLLGGLIALLSLIPFKKAIGAAASLALVVLSFAVATKMLSEIKSIKIAPLITMIIAITVLGGVIALLSMIPFQKTLGAAAALSIMILSLAASMVLVSKVQTVKIAPLLTMIVAVGLLGGLLYLLAPLPIASTLGAVAALSLMLLSLSAAMLILSNIKSIPLGTIASLLAAVISLSIVGTLLMALSGMTWEGIAKGLVALGGSLLILALGLNLMSGTLMGSAALLIAAAALTVLVPSIVTLSSLPFLGICQSLLALAGIFLILGVAGLVLAPLTPIILGLAAAIALIGAGILAAGAGIALFGAGLQSIAVGFTMLSVALSTAAPMFVAGFTAVITGLLLLIPTVITALVNGLVTLCQKLAESAPKIAASVLVIATTILTTLATLIPMVVETVISIFAAILVAIAEYTPTIAQAALDILIAVLEAIANNISRVVQAAIDVVIGFIDGIAKSIPKVIQSAIDLMLAFINGLADGIRNNHQRVIDAVNNLMDAIMEAVKAWFDNIRTRGGELVTKMKDGIKSKASDAKAAIGDTISKMVDKIKEKVKDFKNAAKDLVEGLINGIKEKANAAVEKAKNLAKDCLDAAKKFLGIKSPSRKFMEVGRYSDEGLAVGFSKYAGKVVTAATGVGDKAMGAMSTAIAGIAGLISGEIDAEPTIRPVMDLSDVRAGVNAIGGMFGQRTLAVDTSAVGAISASMAGYQNGGNTDELVSTMKALRKDIADMPRNSYNINGITYDDGSNINDAVATLVRAARIERRT